MLDQFPFEPISSIINHAGPQLGVEAFNSKLDHAFETTHCQILKYESRQAYAEGEAFDRTLHEGGSSGAMKLIDPIVTETLEQFNQFGNSGVRYFRCRPIAFPMSPYMEVQVEVYKRTTHSAAQTVWLNIKAAETFLREYADCDFMVFDVTSALIFDHSPDGEFKGGWEITKSNLICQLLGLFGFLAAQALPVSKLMEK